MPVPHEYYHLTNFMLLVSIVMLAYLLAIQNSFYAAFLYLSLLTAFLGLRELATDFCNPFGKLHSDFPVEKRLAETCAAVDFMLRCKDALSVSALKAMPPHRMSTSAGSSNPLAENPIATEKTQQEELLKIRAIVNDSFARYDLDDSGTINTSEELQQLALNVAVKLDISMDRDMLKNKADEKTALSLEEFIQWFYDLVGEGKLTKQYNDDNNCDEVVLEIEDEYHADDGHANDNNTF